MSKTSTQALMAARIRELEAALRKAEYDAAEAQRDNQKLRARLRDLAEEMNRWQS